MAREEYGGYFRLELPSKNEFLLEIPETDKIRVNCGRAAIYCAVKDAKFKRVYMPYYNCINSVDPVKAAGVEIVYYHLNEDLTPKDICPQKDEGVVWINYYGNATEEIIQKVRGSFENLVIDNCQAMFAPPMLDVYNIYSCRKFVGVPDGGYLVKRGLSNIDLPQSYSASSSNFMLRTIEEGTNAAYQDNLKNEARLENNIAGMSKLTRYILSSIDYYDVKQRRKANFARMHANLKHVNEFEINLNSDTHMFYPLLVMKDELREKLISRKIYTQTLWRHVPEQSGHAKLETMLSKYMVFLPIDQRYNDEDVDAISEIVLDCL